MIREMPIADILNLPSIDSTGLNGCGNSTLTVSDLMSEKTRELVTGGNESPEEYDRIRESMAMFGINTIPIHVDYGSALCPEYGFPCPDQYANSLVMGNGHHRVAIALQLGHATMLVTDDQMESGW
jgi:hypothetical protein